MWGYGAQWGGYTDASGLVLFTHRYYNPSTGQWVTRDPIGYDGGIDLYGYCANSPVIYSDMDGLSKKRNGPGSEGDDSPNARACETAIKILTQALRLAQKFEKKLSRAKIEELREKINNGTITSNDLPGTLLSKFPGEFLGKSLNEILDMCGKRQKKPQPATPDPVSVPKLNPKAAVAGGAVGICIIILRQLLRSPEPIPAFP